jgi:hypothetical protein
MVLRQDSLGFRRVLRLDTIDVWRAALAADDDLWIFCFDRRGRLRKGRGWNHERGECNAASKHGTHLNNVPLEPLALNVGFPTGHPCPCTRDISVL